MRGIPAKTLCGKMLVALAVCSVSLQAGWTVTYAADSDKTAVREQIKKSDTGEYIVKFRKGATKNATMLRAESGGASLSEQGDRHVLLRMNKGAEDKTLESLAADPNVEYIEPNIRMYAADTSIDDEYYPEQWGLDQIQAPAAWDAASGDHDVVVAVLDTGVDYRHPDLAGRVDTKRDYDYVNDDNDARDDEGHGTHVAGIIAAKLDSAGIAGVAGDRNVSILPMKVLNQKGEGDMYNIATAIMDAADLGADVINLSLGGEWDEAVNGKPKLLTEAVQYAMDKGALVVAAAGNDSADVERYVPASISGVVTVSAVDSKRKLASFSNYGSSVDLAAPGVDILSTYPGGRYAFGSGTSQATPFVSGVAALLKASEPDMTVAELTRRLQDTATDLGKIGRDDLYGYGLVNAYQAVGSKKAASPAPVSVKSLKANKSKLSLHPEGTGTITLTASLSDGTKSEVAAADVEWKSKNNKIATVENGIVTAAGFGKTTITASYGGKTVSVPVDITVTRLTAAKTSIALKPGMTYPIELVATYGDQTREAVDAEQITWTSSDKGVAAYQEGRISAAGFGLATVTLSYGGKSVKVSVDTRLKQLQADAAKVTLRAGETFTPTIEATYSDKSKEQVADGIVWTTSNEKVASVNDAGEISAVAKGIATITAKYGKKAVRISITVKTPDSSS
ncbi:S8 family serine peptidase [Brevibacillus brevis]|uniref:S8 family serine peptidase n=1 Tax=Brevibacillus brevis TaxID=1393 RepID=A0ABY9T2Z1_BREBE|nr:S8 family serine peptidase [Brevibacillus brevis]WNC14482.1 S8 family serine peptidase [Brevibacillus brevis]